MYVGKAQKKAERKELLKCEYKEMTNRHIVKSKASNLYVKNLDASIDDRKLEEHFSSFGKVTSAKVMRHDNGVHKGFGFVSFSTPDEAKKALDALHGMLLFLFSLIFSILLKHFLSLLNRLLFPNRNNFPRKVSVCGYSST